MLSSTEEKQKENQNILCLTVSKSSKDTVPFCSGGWEDVLHLL